jgi:predicted Rdx family selenoprotein
MFPTAAWMATEFYAVCGNDLALQLTPAGSGTYAVYLDGEKIWDRKEAPGRPYPDLGIVRDLRQLVIAAVEAVKAAEEAVSAD